jgi:hypothetical protein
MIMKNFTHNELANDLACKLRAQNNLVWQDMPLGSLHSCRPDVFLIRRSFEKPQPISYEVKISVEEFRSDVTTGKWQKYLNFSSAVIFAVPKGLITKADLPPHAGLIVRGDKDWRMAKKPIFAPCELPQTLLLKLLFAGVEKFYKEKDNTVLLRYRWQENKEALKAIGKKYGQDIAQYLTDKKNANENLAQINKKIKFEKTVLQNIQDGIQNQKKDYLLQIAEVLNLSVSNNENLMFLESKIRSQIRDLKKGEEFTSLKNQIKYIESAFQNLEKNIKKAVNNEWMK